jgi:putative nucleotidyltransferase with HDIG domain
VTTETRPIVKQKISAQDLRVGMFVCELDRPWLETPFLFQGFEIRSDQEIRELQRYCRHVFITPIEHYAAAPAPRPAEHSLSRAMNETARRAHGASLEQDLLKITNHPGARATYPDVTTLEEEIEHVREDYRLARELTFSIMEDVRLGKPFDVPGSKKTVAALVDSVIRNPDALTCFIQLKKKHEYTAQHSLRVCVLALMFGRQLGFPPERLNVLGLGALLHDIGKMKVPNEILDKPKALTEEETQIMKSHVPRGVEILEGTVGIAAEAIEVARCHHERYDGGGYATGMRGDDIGTFGLIGGIVDFYDAITSDRAYHAGISPHSALKIMYQGRASAFHPTLVEQFIQCLGIYPVGSVVELNSGEIGVVATLNRVRRLKPRVVLVRRRDGTPYPLAPAVNLDNRKTREGRPCEIERVLEPETSGINPAFFLPVPALS